MSLASATSEIILTFVDPKFRTAAYPQGVIHHLQSTGAHLSPYKLIKFLQGLQITQMYVPAVQAIKNLQRLSLTNGFVALLEVARSIRCGGPEFEAHPLQHGHLAALGSGGAVDA